MKSDGTLWKLDRKSIEIPWIMETLWILLRIVMINVISTPDFQGSKQEKDRTSALWLTMELVT